MTPAHLDITITPGSAWRKQFLLMQPVWRYRQIESITNSAPLRLTVTDHQLPSSGWPIWIEGTNNPALNRDRQRQAFYRPQVMDADTLELNEVSATSAAGGRIAWREPVGLDGCTAELHLPDGTVLTSGEGLELARGSITARLSADQVRHMPAGAWHLTITHADGNPIKWLCGEIKKHDCSQRHC